MYYLCNIMNIYENKGHGQLQLCVFLQSFLATAAVTICGCAVWLWLWLTCGVLVAVP